MTDPLTIEPGDPRDPQATALLHQSHALMRKLFSAGDNYFLDIDELCAPDIRFFVAKQGDTTIGTAALSIKDGYAELKSMFVDPQKRGSGAAGALMRAIETAARAVPVPLLRLETAEILEPAVKLYTRHGFTPCDLFGDYKPNDTSLFMEKTLSSSK